jgi:hypothetical protein
MARPRVTLKASMVGIVLLAVALASLRYASPVWAGAVLLATQAALGLAILGVVYRAGARRAFWLGFAIFGWGYLFQLVGGSDERPVSYSRYGKMLVRNDDSDPPRPVLADLLDALYPMLHQEDDESAASMPFLRWLRSRFADETPIHRALDQPVTMPFPNETMLEDVLKYINGATQSPELPDGLPIYVDPAGLQEAEKTLQSPIALELKGVPLRTSLQLALKQLDLKYEVEDGLVRIGYVASRGSGEALAAFHLLGHCYFALLAGLAGGLLGRGFQARGQRALPLPRP